MSFGEIKADLDNLKKLIEDGLEAAKVEVAKILDRAESEAEKISNDIISNCHQCGSPFDVHTNCANDACHLLFIQCNECKTKMENCCSYKCLEIKQMPRKLQKQLRRGQKNSNDIFKKGRTKNITTFN